MSSWRGPRVQTPDLSEEGASQALVLATGARPEGLSGVGRAGGRPRARGEGCGPPFLTELEISAPETFPWV